MRQERWVQIQALFHSVLERQPAERLAFLAEACGTDATLRSEVEALLSADVDAGSFLEHGIRLGETMLAPGAQLGAYRIDALIGRGGMGEVYRAHDTRLAREVAIKVLPPLSDAAEVDSSTEPAAPAIESEIAGAEQTSSPTAQRAPLEGAAFDGPVARGMTLRRRFEGEALLTASVQHPAVVPIYERGELPGGQPFYSMKLVSGRSLRELLAERKTLADRLALLPNVIAVADALAHAHSRRILHRDVKPSNIIIGEFGETVLIDWGVAKNLSAQAVEVQPGDVPGEADRTAFGSIIGTPAYMSPEQARGQPADERADVFSVGATLYHLLAGEAAYEGDTPAILPRVAQGEYVPLSEKLPEVPPELAAIVDKAMAREAAQRYHTARELTEDLRRFQTGQLVQSHRYSARELLARWAKRHRPLLVATAAFVAVALVSGAIGIRRIVAERDRANHEAEASKRVSQFMTDMFKVSDPSESRGSNVTAREILDKASKQIEGGLSHDPAVEATLMHQMSVVYDSLGLYAKAQQLAETAVKLRQKVLGPDRPETLSSLNVLANAKIHQGKDAEGEKLYREVLDVQRRILGPDHPETLLSMANLSVVLRRRGQYGEAESLSRRVLDSRRRVLGPEHPDTVRSMTNLANVEVVQGKYAEAEKIYEAAIDIQHRVLGADHPDTLLSMSNLAVVEERRGKYDAAEGVNRQVLEIRRRVLGPEHPFTLTSMHNLAGDERAMGKYAEAEGIFRELLSTQRRLLGPEHPDTLASMNSLGIVYFAQKRFVDSEQIRRQLLDISRRVLGPKHPQTLSSMGALAEVESAQGRHDDAEKLCQEALDAQRQVLGPKHVDTLFTQVTLANIYSRQGRYQESEKLQLNALDISQRVFGSNHRQVGLGFYGLGKLSLNEGDRTKALDYLRQAIDHGLVPGDLKRMHEDEELATLRGDPEFETLFANGQKRARVQ